MGWRTSQDFGKSCKIVDARFRKLKVSIEKAMKKFCISHQKSIVVKISLLQAMCFPLAFLSFVYSKRQSWKFCQPRRKWPRNGFWFLSLVAETTCTPLSAHFLQLGVCKECKLWSCELQLQVANLENEDISNTSQDKIYKLGIERHKNEHFQFYGVQF